MSTNFEIPFRTAFAAGLRRLAGRTGIAEERLRRSFLVERLLIRLLTDAPDRWVRFDDLRLEYRYDGVASVHGDSEEVSEHARATVDAALRRVTEYQGLEPVQLAVRHSHRWPQVPHGPALAYHVEASDGDEEIGDVDLLVGFAFPAENEIEWIAGLDVLAAQDNPPPVLPTRSRLTQTADRFGAYTGLTSRFPGCQDLLTIARFAQHLTCTAHEVRQALARTWPCNASPTWPPAVPAPPPWWADEYRLSAVELGLTPTLAVGHAWAAALLDPILSSTVPPGAQWDPTEARWDQSVPEGCRSASGA
ncbi:MAG: hypothetical protein OXG43_11935 [Chloroflexi bacterium]|nr:hypothetical protein [Chloroflexota bacterium]